MSGFDLVYVTSETDISICMKFCQTYPGSTFGLLTLSLKKCTCRQLIIEETASCGSADTVLGFIAINPLITISNYREFYC